jgi:hypothetical protein
MTKKDYSEMSYKELLDIGKSNSDLSDLVLKFECDQDKECTSPVINNIEEEPTLVIIKENSVSDEDATLPYTNKDQTIYAHALVHMWWNMPEKTKWTRLQVSREHTRIVAKLVSNAWGHKLLDGLDDSLPNSLMKDFAYSNGNEIIKPTKTIVVTNNKEIPKDKVPNNAPMVEINYNEVGAMKVILNQSIFESSVSVEKKKDREYRKILDNDSISSTEDINNEDNALYLRINAMDEGIWNFTEISRKELEKSAATFKGRLVIEGHRWEDPECSIGEVLKASVKFDLESSKYYLEVIAKITKERAIKEVNAGRYKFVSIGASMKARCNVCGLTVNEGCEHLRGIEYDTLEHGRILCIKIASEIMFEELSFINVPAARWARVLEKLDPVQTRELLVASKSKGIVGIEVESNDNRILPTLDELLKVQEESIIKFYNKKSEDSVMANDNTNEQTFSAPGSAAPAGAPAAATPQNTVTKPTETTPTPEIKETPGNVSDVAAPVGNPVVDETVNTENNSSSVSNEEVFAAPGSAAPAGAPAAATPQNTVTKPTETTPTPEIKETPGNVSDVAAPVGNPVVDETVNSEVNNDMITLSNEQIDEMGITEIYEYAKINAIDSLVTALVLANEDKECDKGTIDIVSANEAVIVHALLHRWLDDLTLTNWKQEQINAEHDRIVTVLDSFNIGHESEELVNSDACVEEVVETAVETIMEAVEAVVPDALDAIEEAVTTAVEEAVTTAVEEATTVESETDSSVLTIAENVVDSKVELLSKQLEESKKELENSNKELEDNKTILNAVKEKLDTTIRESKESENNFSNEIYELKLNLAKSIRSNKSISSELETAKKMINSKTSEVEILNEKINSFNKKEVEAVVNQLISIKTDMNSYSNEEAITADKAKFSSMTIESLNIIIEEMSVLKNDSIKNKTAEEFGLNNVTIDTKKEDKIEVVKNMEVSGNSEIIKYQNKEGEDVSKSERTTQKEAVLESDDKIDKYVVKKGTLLSLVKESLGNF